MDAGQRRLNDIQSKIQRGELPAHETSRAVRCWNQAMDGWNMRAGRTSLTLGEGGGMQKKVFWLLFMVLGLIADVTLPMIWSLALTLPLAGVCWWLVYRSGWFD
jgi:hypothetical protein